MRETTCTHVAGFAHEALLYAGGEEFVESTAPFVREGLEAGEAVLVAVPRRNAELLREELQPAAGAILWADMEKLGRNPARIIPAWRDFVDAHTEVGRGMRGIGEPVWAQRTPDELLECQRHEMLLNLAFGDAPAWTLLCPYDTTTLGDDIIEEAFRSHPVMWEDGRRVDSPAYADPHQHFAAADEDLPPAPASAERLSYGIDDVATVRAMTARHAARAGLAPERTTDLVLAASEAATNSVLHGGGRGDFAVWREGDAVVCEVRDAGRIRDPLVGRRRPSIDALDGRGLWVVHQLCDLVEVRSTAGGTVVRFRIAER